MGFNPFHAVSLKASPSGEAAARRRLMRAEFAWSPFYRATSAGSPLIRPRAGPRTPSSPKEKAPVSSKGFPEGLRPQARAGAQPPPVLKASPSGEAAARRRLMRQSSRSLPFNGNRSRSGLIRPRRLGHLPPMGKAFMPASPSHPQSASSRLPSSGRRSWCGPRSRSSGRWPYKRHPQTGRCTV